MLSSDLQEKESTIKSMTEERESLKNEIALLRSQNAKLAQDIQTAGSKAAPAVSPEYSARISELEKALAEQKIKAGSLEQKLKYAEDRLLKINIPQEEGTKGTAGEFSSLLKEKENVIMDLMEERDLLESDLSSAKKKSADLEKALAEREAELKKIKEEVGSAMELYVIGESKENKNKQ